MSDSSISSDEESVNNDDVQFLVALHSRHKDLDASQVHMLHTSSVCSSI